MPKYDIAIICNSDDAMLVQNLRNIGVEFDHVITAHRRIWINRRGRAGSMDYLPYDQLPDLGLLPELRGVSGTAEEVHS